MGFEDFSENSWRAGLDRLLLGFAMPGGGEKLFQSILPYDHVEGSETAVLGKLLDFTHRLFSSTAGLTRPRTLEEWAEALAGLMERFFEPDLDSESEAQTMRRTLNDLPAKQDVSGFDEPVGLQVIKSHLSHRLEAESPGLGFITGGVTFCAMLPMRSIPFQVICLVGMDDGAFPRQTRSLGFDLMAKSPRLGDRSQRSDDRYLFLEALLSARRMLYVSYVGQSIGDNSAMPPAVPVCELLDAIDRGYRTPVPGASLLGQITTKHRLQPFSRQYFSSRQDKYFSYSHENCLAAARCRTPRKEPEPLITSPIALPEEEYRSVDIDRLCSFFANPAKFLLAQRLQMRLDSRDFTLEDREAFSVEGLDRYLMEQEMLERVLSSRSVEDYLPVLRAAGRLPHGTVGECGYELLSREVQRFWARIEPYSRARALPPVEVVLDLPPFQVIGRIDRLTEIGLVHFRAAKVKARDRLNLWIRHLVIHAAGGGGHDRNRERDRDHSSSSILIGTDSGVEYRPPDDAVQTLERLLALYWKGLSEPIPFFPQSSFAYARSILDGKPEEAALKAARREWEGERYKSAEKDEAHVALCFRDKEPLDAEFERFALEVFGPLLEHEKPLE
jgi:exodeoxyribonuclease V gamma subunit